MVVDVANAQTLRDAKPTLGEGEMSLWQEPSAELPILILIGS
jgi:hypothetical protein